MRNERGNVLLLILVGIALFAALSYAVLESDENLSTTEDQRRLDISTMMQQGDQIKTAVEQMVYTKGVRIHELEFTSPVYSSYLNGIGYMDNPDCNDDHCRVFTPTGGGIDLPQLPDSIIQDCKANCTLHSTQQDPYWRFFGNHVVKGFGSEELPELFAGVRVSKETCIEINNILGIENPSGAPPNYDNTGHMQTFDGAADLNAPPNSTGWFFPAQLDNQPTGCVNQEHSTYSNERYIFYVILQYQ